MAFDGTVEKINNLPDKWLHALVGLALLILVFLFAEQFFPIILAIALIAGFFYLKDEPFFKNGFFPWKSLPKTAKIAIAAIALLLISLAFFKKIFNIVLVLLIFSIALFIALKMLYGKPSLKELFRKKKEILLEINLLEKKFMKRQFDQKAFDDLFKSKQAQLIELEAQIDSLMMKSRPLKELDSLKDISARKQHLLKELWIEKENVLVTMHIAEKKYLTRKISEQTFRQIMQSFQEKLVKLEAQIKNLQFEDSAEKVMQDLKSRLKQVEEEMKEEQQNQNEEMTKALMEDDRNELQ